MVHCQRMSTLLARLCNNTRHKRGYVVAELNVGGDVFAVVGCRSGDTLPHQHMHSHYFRMFRLNTSLVLVHSFPAVSSMTAPIYICEPRSAGVGSCLFSLYFYKPRPHGVLLIHFVGAFRTMSRKNVVGRLPLAGAELCHGLLSSTKISERTVSRGIVWTDKLRVVRIRANVNCRRKCGFGDLTYANDRVQYSQQMSRLERE